MPKSNIKNESEFQTLLLQAGKQCNANAFSIKGGMYQKKGIADTYIDHNLWWGWLELKLDENHLSPEQKWFLENTHSSYCLRLRRIENAVTIENADEKVIAETCILPGPVNKSPEVWRKFFFGLMTVLMIYENEKQS